MDNNNMLKLCRLCLVKDDVNIPIFEEQGDIRQIFLKISSCLPVKVSRDDQLPKKICDGCSYKLDMLYEFWNTSANAEKQLLTWLGEAGMSSQMADGTISAVAQQIKPADAFVKQETIDPPDIHMDDDDDDDEEDKDYMKQEDNSNNVEEPPPKRARRTAAVKAAIALDQNSDDDDDSGEPMTKVEDDSEDSDNEDHEPAFVDVPSTSADDQPGPSGVGKDGVEAPSKMDAIIEIFEKRYPDKPLRRCYVDLPDILQDKNLKFVNNSVKLKPEGRHKYVCYVCWLKFNSAFDLYKHKETHKDELDDPIDPAMMQNQRKGIKTNFLRSQKKLYSQRRKRQSISSMHTENSDAISDNNIEERNEIEEVIRNDKKLEIGYFYIEDSRISDTGGITKVLRKINSNGKRKKSALDSDNNNVSTSPSAITNNLTKDKITYDYLELKHQRLPTDNEGIMEKVMETKYDEQSVINCEDSVVNNIENLVSILPYQSDEILVDSVIPDFVIEETVVLDECKDDETSKDSIPLENIDSSIPLQLLEQCASTNNVQFTECIETSTKVIEYEAGEVLGTIIEFENEEILKGIDENETVLVISSDFGSMIKENTDNLVDREFQQHRVTKKSCGTIISLLNFQCKTCDIHLETFKKFAFHTFYNKTCIFCCKICDRTYKDTHDICKHMCKHKYKYNFFMCPFCPHYFYSFRRILSHLEKLHKCNVLKRKPADLLSIYHRLKPIDCPGVYVCQQCTHVFESKSSLRLHSSNYCKISGTHKSFSKKTKKNRNMANFSK
ncbi:uncharacterized protein LOC130897056 isoform X7 [Diorhabda carinulata]|uniref:uncharacterized protein LOC130897056 isoform X7 n=1 Tax=Diorhabda carinulata TaxID=1163345 RepID=UPI0025A0E3F9|nr:uncharacterized protein LOC130897056 isoform X7 [Diorhabda carinulata]